MIRRITLALVITATILAGARPAFADGPITLGRGSLSAIALSPDGTRLAVGTPLGVYLFDAQSFALQTVWENGQTIRQMVWSPDGGQLLVIGGGQVQAHAVADGALRWSQPIGCDDCEWAYSPDGVLIASISDFTQVRLFEAGTGRPAQSLNFADFFAAIAWQFEHLSLPDRQSLNGRRLALGRPGYYSGMGVLVYDVAGRFAYNQTYTYAAALSPDGSWLAASDYDGVIELYAVGEKRPALTWPGLHDGYTRAQLTWSPDSQTLYGAAHNQVVAWDRRSGAVLRTLDGFTTGVAQVAWSADGRRLIASQAINWAVGIWPAVSRTPLAC